MSAPDAGATSEPAPLVASGLFKRYGAREALRGVDLVARRGEVHGLLGPNGAGKTTLMRLVLGLVRPDAGSIRLLGVERGATSRPLPSGVAGFVETPGFYPYLTARQNLRLMLRLDHDPPRARAKAAVGDALDQVRLGDAADVKVGGFSAGMRQRLAVAAALLRSPQLLLLDEPTGSLDPAGARDLRARVRRLAEDGVAVVLSSHDMAEVEDLCATLTIVNRGKVVFSGAIEELRRLAPASVHLLRSSDDDAALALAPAHPGVAAARAIDGGGGLEVTGSTAALDAFVIALGQGGVAVRSLEVRARSLESLFLRLTEQGAAPPASTAAASHDDAPAPRNGDEAA